MKSSLGTPRIVVVGAGSASFGLSTLGDLLTVGAEPLAGSTVVLCDRDRDALSLMERAFRAALAPRTRRDEPVFTVECSEELEQALEGAGYVIVSIENGNRAHTWAQDYYVPLRHGSRQVYGENGGPGGAFHTWRQLPAHLAIARAMERLCPDAWLLNYSNPLSRIIWGLSASTSIKCVGLCHGIGTGLAGLERALGTSRDTLDVTSAGINHFYWFIRVNARVEFDMPPIGSLPGKHIEAGTDLLEEVRARGVELAQAEERPFLAELLRLYGYFTYPSESHPAEYVAWSDAYCRAAKYDFQELAQRGARMRERLRRTLDGAEDDSWWKRPSGERAVHIIAGIERDTGHHEDSVNLRNGATITNLPPQCVVETPATVGEFGIVPEPIGELPHPIARLLHKEVIVQEAVVEAALANDYGLALQALILDETVPNPRAAENILDEMLELQRGLLPDFRR